ncbi:unnamed protein product [Urochloa decumbens]|uniref:F-box domain-containing protein n=1 Tax=Urochloa decumbens TaxID=240449 RepID=A0ABC9AWL4_9POAL
MPDSRGNSKRAAVVVSVEEDDRISALPDGVLQLLLSSLPSDEAVQTCVLARRWRHLWKSTPALRITRGGGRDWTAWTLNNFVNHLLLLRGGSPADECEISCDEFHVDDDDEVFRFVNLWIRHVFSFCQAGAKNLELTSDYDAFIFRTDCKLFPIFSKLKTLLLNEWCVAADFGALIFFLQNSPVLEKLTLQLEHYERKQPVVEAGDSYNPTEHSLVSKQLKVVEIKCRKENELTEQISNILRIHGVPPEQIEIQESLLPSETSSFELDRDSDS